MLQSKNFITTVMHVCCLHNTSSEVNLLQTSDSTVIHSVSRVDEISSQSTSPSINISSQLATDSFINSICQVSSENPSHGSAAANIANENSYVHHLLPLFPTAKPQSSDGFRDLLPLLPCCIKTSFLSHIMQQLCNLYSNYYE